MDVDEGSGGEGEQVGGDRFGFGEFGFGDRALGLDFPRRGVRDDGPSGGILRGQREATFQIRLVKARKGHARVHRDEERVEIFRAVVVVLEAGDGFAGGSDVRSELCLDDVFARVERRGGQDEVPMLHFDGKQRAVEAELRNHAVAEVEQKRSGGVLELEADLLGSRRGWSMRLQLVAEFIVQIRYAGGSFPGPGARDAVRNFGGMHGGGSECDDGHEGESQSGTDGQVDRPQNFQYSGQLARNSFSEAVIPAI
jgi:hypothetical protein